MSSPFSVSSHPPSLYVAEVLTPTRVILCPRMIPGERNRQVLAVMHLEQDLNARMEEMEGERKTKTRLHDEDWEAAGVENGQEVAVKVEERTMLQFEVNCSIYEGVSRYTLRGSAVV